MIDCSLVSEKQGRARAGWCGRCCCAQYIVRARLCLAFTVTSVPVTTVGFLLRLFRTHGMHHLRCGALEETESCWSRGLAHFFAAVQDQPTWCGMHQCPVSAGSCGMWLNWVLAVERPEPRKCLLACISSGLVQGLVCMERARGAAMGCDALGGSKGIGTGRITHTHAVFVRLVWACTCCAVGAGPCSEHAAGDGLPGLALVHACQAPAYLPCSLPRGVGSEHLRCWAPKGPERSVWQEPGCAACLRAQCSCHVSCAV